MADPLGLEPLIMGDASAYIRQNERNLVLSRLAAPLLKDSGISSTYPAPGIESGDMYIIGSAAITGNWSTASENDIAIALADDPVGGVNYGWSIITPVKGMIAHNGTAPLMWDGTAWTAL